MRDLTDKKIYFDTNLAIYAIEGFVPYREILIKLFSAIDDGLLTAVTSELTICESLVHPFQDGDPNILQAYESLFSDKSGLDCLPVTRDILIDAARIRAKHESLKMPDAIHLATSKFAKCDIFLTNDKRLPRLDSTVLLLDDLNG